jgi:hypothetical protein
MNFVLLQVPLQVLAACTGVMTQTSPAAKAAYFQGALAAKLLVTHAGIDLPPIEASTNGGGTRTGSSSTVGSSGHSGTSSTCRSGGDGSSSRSAGRSTGSSSGSGRHGSSSSSGSSSKLTAMLWEQFEQSGILQQLPTILTRQALDIQSPLGQPVRQQTRMQSQAGFGIELFTRSEYTVSLFELLHNLNKLQPSFLTAHPAGQQCLVPALHLALSSLQSISTAVKQAGPQECLENLLQYS